MQVRNINDQVVVTLTPRGAAVWDAYWKPDGIRIMPPSKVLKETPDGFVAEIELWGFAAIFGPHLCNGCPQLFAKNAVRFVSDAMDNDKPVKPKPNVRLLVKKTFQPPIDTPASITWETVDIDNARVYELLSKPPNYTTCDVIGAEAIKDGE